jgi:hypothetical protein
MPGMGDKLAKAAVEVTKKAAKNKELQKAAAGAATWVGKKGGGAVMASRRNRKQAHALARQVGGKYSEGTIIAHREYLVVWKDGRPLACFPPLTPEQLNGKELCDCEELQGFNESLLRDPPPVKAKR